MAFINLGDPADRVPFRGMAANSVNAFRRIDAAGLPPSRGIPYERPDRHMACALGTPRTQLAPAAVGVT